MSGAGFFEFYLSDERIARMMPKKLVIAEDNVGDLFSSGKSCRV